MALKGSAVDSKYPISITSVPKQHEFSITEILCKLVKNRGAVTTALVSSSELSVYTI